MNHNLKLLLLVLIFSLFIVPVFAQDGELTAEPTVVEVEAGTDVVIVNEGGPVDPATPTNDTQFTLAALLDFAKWAGILLTVLVGGRALLTRVDTWLKLKSTDVAFMTRGEGLAAWTPAAIKDNLLGFVNDGISVGKSLHDILTEWVDNEPYAAKKGVSNVTKPLPKLEE